MFQPSNKGAKEVEAISEPQAKTPEQIAESDIKHKTATVKKQPKKQAK